jgi:hypothetical protein
VRYHDEGAEPIALDEVEASGEPVNLRVILRNGERDRRVEEHGSQPRGSTPAKAVR